MRVAWLTDIHFNFVPELVTERFIARVEATRADVVVVSGDIAEAPTLATSLEWLARCGADILYVLGNHDFYRGRIDEVRQTCRSLSYATYLHGAEPVALTRKVGIVGVDGWGDGGYGRPRDSDLIFTDWHLIHDFREVDAIMNIDNRLRLLAQQAEESAEALRRALEVAVEEFGEVWILTHVPPFERAAGHDGSAMAELWVPWLACKATGAVIADFAERYPDTRFEVLCGHTHVARVVHHRSNVRIRTGGARYRRPEMQDVWDLE